MATNKECQRFFTYLYNVEYTSREIKEICSEVGSLVNSGEHVPKKLLRSFESKNKKLVKEMRAMADWIDKRVLGN